MTSISLGKIPISFLLNSESPKQPTEEDSDETIAAEETSSDYPVIYRHEAETFFYVVGSQIKKVPGIWFEKLYKQCSGIKSVRQLGFILDRMKEQKLLRKGEHGNGLYVTDKFSKNEREYEKAALMARSENRSTVNLRSRQEYKLSEPQQILINLIYDSSGIAVKKLRASSGLSHGTFRRALDKLLASEFIQRKTYGLAAFYYPKDFLTEKEKAVDGTDNEAMALRNPQTLAKIKKIISLRPFIQTKFLCSTLKLSTGQSTLNNFLKTVDDVVGFEIGEVFYWRIRSDSLPPIQSMDLPEKLKKILRIIDVKKEILSVELQSELNIPQREHKRALNKLLALSLIHQSGERQHTRYHYGPQLESSGSRLQAIREK